MIAELLLGELYSVEIEATLPVLGSARLNGHDLARRVTRQLSCWPMLGPTVVATREVRCAMIDRWLGIQTAGERCRPKQTAFGDSLHYGSTDYLLLRKLAKPLALAGNDVVYDVGCGMGRTLCALARRRVAKCVGIEADGLLAEIAARNARQLRGRRAAIEVRLCDAAVAEYIEGTVFWFNNPFGDRTLRAVMRVIERSLVDNPRHIRIAYVHPVQEHVLASMRWLRCYQRLQPLLYTTAEASYWTNDLD